MLWLIRLDISNKIKGPRIVLYFQEQPLMVFFEDYVAREFIHSWDPTILAKRLDDVKPPPPIS